MRRGPLYRREGVWPLQCCRYLVRAIIIWTPFFPFPSFYMLGTRAQDIWSKGQFPCAQRKGEGWRETVNIEEHTENIQNTSVTFLFLLLFATFFCHFLSLSPSWIFLHSTTVAGCSTFSPQLFIPIYIFI